MTNVKNQGRGGDRGGRGQGRGRGGFRAPVIGSQEVPMLRYGPPNNWTLFKERIGKHALERFGDLGRLIETEAYYVPPEIDKNLYDLANDPDGMNKVLLQEALKARQKCIMKMQNDRANFYGYILGKLSLESLDALKRHKDYAKFNVSLDVLDLWKALKDIHMTQTTSRIDTVIKKATKDDYRNCVQGEFESVTEFKTSVDVLSNSSRQYKMPPTIYVLLCENNYYYVGRTDRPLGDRIQEHFSRNGSEWTRRYKPIKVVETITDADELDEDKYTKKYMMEHGIDRVRGGSNSQPQVPDNSRLALEKELCNASNLCFRCNRRGHFASNCYASSKADGSPIDHEGNDDKYTKKYMMEHGIDRVRGGSNSQPQVPDNSRLALEKELCNASNLCFRCNRRGHFASNCYASSKADGSPIDDERRRMKNATIPYPCISS